MITSPPFPLQRTKSYGRPAGESEFVEWFLPFASEVRRVLAERGSFVIDLGGVYVKREFRRKINPIYPTLNLYTQNPLLSLRVTIGAAHMASQVRLSNDLSKKVKMILSKTPGLSIKELAKMSHVNRQFMAGFLMALEERGDVYSRKVGPARIYFNNEVKSGE